MNLEVIKFKIRKFVLYTIFFIVAFELNENHENETFFGHFQKLCLQNNKPDKSKKSIKNGLKNIKSEFGNSHNIKSNFCPKSIFWQNLI